MRRKVIALLVSIALAASLLSGCGGRTSGMKQGTDLEENTDSGELADGEAATAEGAENGSGNIALLPFDDWYEEPVAAVDDNYRNFYEIFVYSFCDTDGDGIGDFKGVEEKLPYIEAMGFNALWLMPIMPSTTYHKYDVTDYMAVDPEYGTMEDFESLIAACHEKGIRVTIDFVINHSSAKHPWFQEACRYLEGLTEGEEADPAVCPYVDYYHFSKEQVDQSWYQVGSTGWYYEGSFWDQMPDLNLACGALQEELKTIADFWMDKGVDGFRMDAVLHFEEAKTDFNTGIMNWLYEYCREKNPDFYMVSEVWSDEGTIANYYSSLTPSMFNFCVAGSSGAIVKVANGAANASQLVKALTRYQEEFEAVNPDYIDAPFITNHDQARVANALVSDVNKLKMAAGLLLTMSGNPFVYYGEEIGMKSAGDKDENKRVAMYWSRDPEAEGMTDGPKDADEVPQALPSWEEQLGDADSLLNYYRRALNLRNKVPEIARGEITVVDSLCSGNQAAITKTWGDSTIGIVYNTGEEEIQVDINGTDLIYGSIEGYLTLSADQEVTLNDGILTMPGRSIVVLK